MSILSSSREASVAQTTGGASVKAWPEGTGARGTQMGFLGNGNHGVLSCRVSHGREAF